MIAIVDYGAGNVQSVRHAIARLGAAAMLSDDPALLAKAELLVFPGQGHFGQAMGELRRRGLVDVLHGHIAAGRPFVGICLGMQLLFDTSAEAPGVAGLGVFAGDVVRLPERGSDGARLKVPQIGWNDVQLRKRRTPLDGPGDGASYYFAHSYHAVATDARVVAATCDHGGADVVAAVRRDNVFAVQFHPEKSGAVGMALWSALLGRSWWGRAC